MGIWNVVENKTKKGGGSVNEANLKYKVGRDIYNILFFKNAYMV